LIIEGQPLNRRLEKCPLSAQQVLQCGIEIAEALEKAHKSGIVHRDLKAGNIMLTKLVGQVAEFWVGQAPRRHRRAGRIIANTDIVESTHVINIVVDWTTGLKK
jgi:serine/threonine protein kinase